jgi:hypothetical protein
VCKVARKTGDASVVFAVLAMHIFALFSLLCLAHVSLSLTLVVFGEEQ